MALTATLNNVANLQDTTTAATTINNNYSTLTTTLADGVSRSGIAPNAMGANLDMSSFHILNLPAPGGPLEPVRLTDVASSLNVVSGPVTYGTRTQSVGLAAVTGTALTLARSDSAPALDQTIAPTWTGQHTFNTAGGTVVSVILSGATAGALTIKVQGSAGGVITFPNGPDTLVGRVTTDTLTNKTIPSPVISGGALTDLTITRPTFSGSAGGTYTLSYPTIQSPAVTGGAFTAITLTGSMTGGNITNTIVGSSGLLNVGLFSTLSGTTVTGTTSVLSSGTGGVGYSTGAGGTVTQGTSKTTGVVLNAATGDIILFSANAATANTTWTFNITNNAVVATDLLLLNVSTTISTNAGLLYPNAITAAGGAKINIRALANFSSDNVVLSYAIIKGVTS